MQKRVALVTAADRQPNTLDTSHVALIRMPAAVAVRIPLDDTVIPHQTET